MALSLPHPSFYPDLATCAIFPVFTFKEMRLRTQTELLGSAVVQYLDHIPKEDYEKHALEQRLKTCVTAQGPEFEKKCTAVDVFKVFEAYFKIDVLGLRRKQHMRRKITKSTVKWNRRQSSGAV